MSTANPAALNFRSAVEADVPELVKLVESAYRGEASRGGWTTEADYLDGQRTDENGVRQVISAPTASCSSSSARANSSPAASSKHRGDHAYFGMFAVRPGLQGAGLGKEILAEAERRARETWQATEMRMTVVNVREELIAYYVRRGYRRTGELSPFPYGDARFGIPLRDDLAFELLVKPL